MRYVAVFGALAVGGAALAFTPLAAHAVPLAPANLDTATASEVVPARHRYGHRSCRRYYRYARGYYRGGARRGNINGCSIDLGYGRYEPCSR